jgi:hypothetical protein
MQTKKSFDRQSVTNEELRRLYVRATETGDDVLATDCLSALDGNSAAAERCIDALERRAS